MTYLLHIDTSADNGFVAISADGHIVSAKSIEDSKNQSALINTLIDGVLSEANIAMQQLSAITVCAGPGSYTGLRIGMGTAKGLCYALDKPLLLDNKLTLLAWQQYNNLNEYDVFLSMLIARENEFFIGAYDKEFKVYIEPQHIHAAELEELLDGINGRLLITGETDKQIENIYNVKKAVIIPNKLIDKDAWAMYAYEQYKCQAFVNLSTAEPFYLKQVFTHKSNKIN
ncbi:MAG: tRNA (adenosine(37)-N6)-threonylcarbamoyltransferase complex dimerization subunit type 1 TsaB [Flavipsychrobacter sp.]